MIFNNLKYRLIKRKILSQDPTTQRRTISELSPELAHKIFYFINSQKDLNLDNPQNFNEKIHYLMLYVHGNREAKLADKYLVREYLKKHNLENIAPKLYGVYNSPDEIDFSKLPNRFVLKCNHGCGDIEFCENKTEFNIQAAKKHLAKALADDFSTHNLEPHYHHIDHKIICEEFLPVKKGKLPLDYKFYCFNGKAKFLLVCSERETNLRLDYFDLNWNYLPYAKPEFRSNKSIPKPKNLSKMVQIAEKLSKDFPYVRIDLYNINGKIYFSEMTFTPAAGKTDYNTEEALNYIGSLIKLPPKRHKPEHIKLSY